MKRIIGLAVIVALLTSCSVVKTSTSKKMDIIGAGVIHLPVVAELNVQPDKRQLTQKYEQVLSLEVIKNDAVSELLRLHKADVLIEPTFETETKGGKTEITVRGWPATYKNFRTIEEKDIRLIETVPGVIQKAEVYAPAVEKKKNK